MMQRKMMKRKLMHSFLAALLVVMQLCTLVGIRHVQAVESPSVEQTLIDSDDLTLKATGVQNGELIDWTLQYERKTSPAQRALKIDVQADDTALTPIDATGWHQLQAADTPWWQEIDFTTECTGSLRYQTPITQTSLTIMAQLDEQATDPVVATTEAATDEAPVATEPQLNVDLLDEQTAGPHTVTLTLPEVEQPVPDPEDEAAQAEATEESVVTPTLPAESDTQTESTVTAPESKLLNDPILEPNATVTAEASNLVLTLDAFATLAVRTTAGERMFKNPSSNYNYDSETNMRNRTSQNYVANSSSAAVIFSGIDQARNARIDLSYDNVGFAQLADGRSVKIGARVVVDQFKFRNSDWGNNNTKMGIDFSNNFYSGMQLANIRSFDWKVTFFVADDTRATINFIENSDARLTFTSLNPGEFVKPHDKDLIFSTADSNSVKLTGLHANHTGPNQGEAYFTNWIKNGWPQANTPEITAYTSHKWGDWDNPATVDPKVAWGDKLGAPTFGNGAAAFALVGSSFAFTRGTYFDGATTWLANASGDAKFVIPKYVRNNKSISAYAGKGGGTAQSVNETPVDGQFTPNDLHEQNINEQALADQVMYYYINQQTYSLAADLVSLPEKIVIKDTLPDGMTFATNSDNDIVIYNERSDNDTRDRILFGAEIVRDKQDLTITLPYSVLQKIPFAGGFFSIQIAVKTTHDPNTITEAYSMDNEATTWIYGSGVDDPWHDTTNMVTVEVTPNLVNPTFSKVDEFDQALPGVTFQLFTNQTASGTPKYTATSDNSGKVAFKEVQPGQYWLKEAKTPVGYVPLATPIAITVNKDGSITWPKGWQHNKVVNDLKRWTIELEKTDADQKRLAHAEFQLSKADGSKIISAITSANANLILNPDWLVPGDYVLEETKAPTGFTKLKGKFTFTLNLDGTISNMKYTGSDLTDKQYRWDAANHKLHLTLENNADEVPLPVTGGSGIQALIATAVMLMALALMLGWHWRKEALR